MTCMNVMRNQVYCVMSPTAATALSEYPESMKMSTLEKARKRRFSITIGYAILMRDVFVTSICFVPDINILL